LAEEHGRRSAPPPDDSSTFLSSSLSKAGEHFAAKDREEADGVERWATRIGRGLSLVAFGGLAWYFGRQLNWW
jgi:hypothetical protein